MTDNPNWLEPADWKWVQDTMPIACCDALPVQVGGDGRTITKIGLIYRDVVPPGKRWCMVGGRMWRNESMAEALARQLRETLGPKVRFQIDPDCQPLYVVQYFTSRRSIGIVDPRQHALTMSFIIPITGEITPMGEAESFKWFEPDALPPADRFGFQQDVVIQKCLAAWAVRPIV